MFLGFRVWVNGWSEARAGPVREGGGKQTFGLIQ